MWSTHQVATAPTKHPINEHDILMQTCDESLTIRSLKQQLAVLENTAEDLIVLVHSGVELTDDMVPSLCGMDRFSGTGELFLDLQVLSLPDVHAVLIFAYSSAQNGWMEAGENARPSARLSG